ncbi:MAG TPA: hypothetical protein PKD86_11800 [Gemmatales bacterium]|nr:hypothetical protein [Gemmatales bacterium]HMP60027.1 hypothetical protein [Gemmatales bacterium]
MGGIRPETKAMKKRKVRIKAERRRKPKFPTDLGINLRMNRARKEATKSTEG